MSVFSFICWLLIFGIVLAIPVLSIILLFRLIFKKSCKRLGIVVLCFIGSILPLVFLAVVTNPATWCEHEYAIIEDVQPTCTEKGKIVKHCPNCNSKTYRYPDKLPHSWGEEERVDATCTQQGHIKKTCSVCSVEDIVYINMLPHSWVENITVASTCTEKGYIKRICDGCSAEHIEYTEKIAHSWETDSVVNPTCTSGGYTMEKCLGCYATRETNVTSLLGHDMNEVSRTEPVGDVDGCVTYKCSRCPEEVTEVIPSKEEVHEIGKIFDFQFKGSTALSYTREFCEHPGHLYLTHTFRGTPSDLSYLEAIKEHSDSDEIVWGEYYTITATVTMYDHYIFDTRINCKAQSGNIIVYFSVDFREEFEDAVGLLDVGDEVTFRGKFYDEGCGFLDAELIVE